MHGFQRAARSVNHIFTRGTMPSFVLATGPWISGEGKDDKAGEAQEPRREGYDAGEASLLDLRS